VGACSAISGGGGDAPPPKALSAHEYATTLTESLDPLDSALKRLGAANTYKGLEGRVGAVETSAQAVVPRDDAGHGGVDGRRVGDVERERLGGQPVGPELLGHRVRRLAGQVGDHGHRAVLGQAAGRGAAQSARAAGDQCHLAGQFVVHARPFSSERAMSSFMTSFAPP